MRIAIDARFLTHPQVGGYKSYTTNLIQALLTQDSGDEYLLYVDREPPDGAPVHRGNVTVDVVPRAGGWLSVPLREQAQLPARVRHHAPDVVHFPCATAPWQLLPCPLIVTVHDTIEFLERPRLSLPLRESARRVLMNRYYRSAQRVASRRARVIITDSLHSKRDVVRTLGADERTIRVVPISHGPEFRPLPEEDREAVAQQYGLQSPFVLALASTSPRKNAGGLLRIYERLPRAVRARYQLVVVWSHALLQPAVRAKTERLGLDSHVRFLPQIARDDLVRLYNAAEVFVYPSKYEGFGLPVLEAMACGTPVVASDRTSIPEVAGEAAALVDPDDEDAFAETLQRVIDSPERRAAMREAGLARAAQFSWDRTARMTHEIYREVAG